VTKHGFGKHIGTVQNFSDRAMFLKVWDLLDDGQLRGRPLIVTDHFAA
jgi:hypothetical protein